MIQTVKYSLLVFFYFNLIPAYNFAQGNFPPINPKDVQIVRDKWGVPHIYGKTDADAAYGLAWASAEDNFGTMQEVFLAMHGKLGSVQGKEGAILDVMNHIVRPSEIVAEKFEDAFSPEFRKVLNAYVQGLNTFAETHPDQVLDNTTFPAKETDIIEGYVLSLTLMTNVHFDVIRLMENKLIYSDGSNLARGSNAFAFNGKKMKNGNPVLITNSHQPIEGPFSWYEAHVNSEDGWNFLGGVLAGGITPFLGTNENLGWAHTLNYPDLSDVFQLEMHPTEKLKYKFDGAWLDLEKYYFKFKVKVGPFKIPIRKKFYKSKYGTTFKNKSGFFALRHPSNLSIKAAEQWFHMNKAKNLDEFQEALNMQGIPGINTIYTDNADNILFLSNGHFPYRNPKYNWETVVPGNTSETLWPPKYMPLDSMVLLKNPNCGYLFNMNNTPFNCTCPAENPKPENYNPTIGYLKGDTGRSKRFGELIAQHDKLSYEELMSIKYDKSAPTPMYNHTIQNVELLLNLDPEKYPDIKESIKVLSRWNRSSDVKNKQAALVILSFQYIVDDLLKRGKIDQANVLPEAFYAKSLAHAQKYLKKHFGKLEIELGTMQKHVRGKVEKPIGGMPEVLATIYSEKYKKGKRKSRVGESYIQYIEYAPEGLVLKTINCFGASTHENSPHYMDQMDMYLNHEMKEMTLDKERIFREAKKIYHPGISEDNFAKK